MTTLYIVNLCFADSFTYRDAVLASGAATFFDFDFDDEPPFQTAQSLSQNLFVNFNAEGPEVDQWVGDVYIGSSNPLEGSRSFFFQPSSASSSFATKWIPVIFDARYFLRIILGFLTFFEVLLGFESITRTDGDREQ